MKLFIVLILLVLCQAIAPRASAQAIVTAFNAKAMDTSQATHTDTSAAIPLKNFPYVDLAISVRNTDSSKIITVVDYQIGSVWLVGVRDTLKYGSAVSGSVAARGVTMRYPGTNPFPGATSVRLRSTVTKFATTTSGTKSYSLYLLLRRAEQSNP